MNTPDFILFLVKSSSVLLLAFGLSFFIKNPSLRATLWTTTLLCLPLVLLLSLTAPLLELIPLQKAIPSNTATELSSEANLTPAQYSQLTPISDSPPMTSLPSSLEEGRISDKQPVSSPPRPIPLASSPVAEVILPSPTSDAPPSVNRSFSWFVTIYLLGAFLTLLPIIISLFKLSRLPKSDATDLPLSLWRNIATSSQTLQFVDGAVSPFSTGIFRPRVFLPAESVHWSPRRLNSTLLHEVAHLQRHDPLTRLLITFVRALFWFHPLIWLAQRHLIIAQEQSCDNHALAQGIAPDDYAEDLLSSATHSHLTPSEVLTMARWSQIGKRVHHILESPPYQPINPKNTLLISGLAFVSSLAFGTLGFAELKPPSSSEKAPEPQELLPEKILPQEQGKVRTLTRLIPAPRGHITDRNGLPLASNRVSYSFALQFPSFPDGVIDQEILAWAQKRIEQVSQLTSEDFSIPDKRLLSHYKNRHLVPLLLGQQADAAQKQKWEHQLISGLEFQAITLRNYPAQSSAAHVLGYVQQDRLPQGPLHANEPIWEQTHGVAGLEKNFEKELAGQDGEKTISFDENGDRSGEELTQNPTPGNTVVTTLDLTWQEHAEDVLKRSARRGAMVVVDIPTGEILVLASRPSYDLNQWIPMISSQEYNTLREDENTPLFGRAFQGSYPPGSTFKPVTAAAALTTNTVTEHTTYDCPPFITIGSRRFHNHSRKHEGRLNVTKALSTSNNVWFYQAALDVGPTQLFSLARRMGYGSPTGASLDNEASGRVPTSEYMLQKEGRPFTDADIFNTSVGQGHLSATPLQVAQAMTALADGQNLPQLRLVRQILSPDGKILSTTAPKIRNPLDITPESAEITRRGMMNAVNSSHGTGKRGGTSFCRVAGKTGTAQWRGSGKKKQLLGWFAGFLPYENPRYAFAILYEGLPGETISGGRNAAPLTGRFFNHFAEDILKTIATDEKNTTPPRIPTFEVK